MSQATAEAAPPAAAEAAARPRCWQLGRRRHRHHRRASCSDSPWRGTTAAHWRSQRLELGSATPERLLLLERVAKGVALLQSGVPTLIVHGDIKRARTRCSWAEGTPRLSDFGLAEVKRAVATSACSVSARATRGDHASGTFPYMAPEMCKRRDAAAHTASPATDVHSLSTLAWEVLAGEPPWAVYSPDDCVLALRVSENRAPAGRRAGQSARAA
jgi:serine/threonine protein kinase